MRISGKLHVMPELTWEDLRDTPYIPFELAVAQGRNSQRSMGLTAEMKDRLTEDGQAFVKYADSLVFRQFQRAETIGVLVWYIDQVMQRFPDHMFEGRFSIDMLDGRDDHRIEVRDSDIKVLTHREVWAASDLPEGDLDRLLRDSDLLMQAQTLLQRVHATGLFVLHSGKHVDANGRKGCLGCDLENFLARNAKTRSV